MKISGARWSEPPELNVEARFPCNTNKERRDDAAPPQVSLLAPEAYLGE